MMKCGNNMTFWLVHPDTYENLWHVMDIKSCYKLQPYNYEWIWNKESHK